jgi:hypothetical protein
MSTGGRRALMGDQVRFDDSVTTLLDWDMPDAADRARIWRQLADVVSRVENCDDRVLALALERLIETEQDVAPADRRQTISSLDLAASPPDFLNYLARDQAVYGALLPAAAQPVRAIATPIADDPLDDRESESGENEVAAGSQITDLLARIDAFHARREDDREGGFTFQIDEAGAIRARDGTVPLAHCGEPSQGVDGQVAGAWRNGEHFADARLSVERGPYAGEWRISADPQHDEAGRTIGYRGVAREPRAEETAVMPPPLATQKVDVPGLDGAVDRLRGLLGAIVEAVDPKSMPPGEIRLAAGEVAARSAALAAAIDALELAVAAAGDGGLDMAALLVRIDAALRPMAEARGLKISFRLARGLPPVDADPKDVERMVARLIGAVVALGWRGEQIVAPGVCSL